MKLRAVGCETYPRPDGATHAEMVPPIIKADLPSLLVLAHGGLANGEAALQPAAFAALQTYPGVGEFKNNKYNKNLLHLIIYTILYMYSDPFYYFILSIFFFFNLSVCYDLVKNLAFLTILNPGIQ